MRLIARYIPQLNQVSGLVTGRVIDVDGDFDIDADCPGRLCDVIGGAITGENIDQLRFANAAVANDKDFDWRISTPLTHLTILQDKTH